MLRSRSFAQRAAKQARAALRHEARSVLPLAVAPSSPRGRVRLGRRVAARRSDRQRDAAHLSAVHDLPCCARHLGPCSGRIEADHAGARPLGRRADDVTCIPLCTGHHRQRTDFTGDFRDFDQPRMRAFLAGAIADTQRALARIAAADGRQETAA